MERPTSCCHSGVLPDQLPCTESKCKNITISYTITCKIQSPSFNICVKVTGTDGEPFIRFMERAADANGAFVFSAQYYRKLGYFITGINHVEGDPGKTYWEFVKAPSEILPVGVSSYKPRNGDHIVFRLATQSSTYT